MKPFTRADRVGGLIQKALSDILHRRIKDPRLEGTTITGVRMSPDLKLARIYFTTSGDQARKEAAIEGYNHALGYVKRILARRLGLRYMPDLRFFYDESFDYGSHMDKMLKSVKTNDEPNHTPFEK
ncbi:MAG: 30S ribosome-binding factor RbfA [Deltaproteobacteria bacterium]|nr:30S ribosome-binding factor RbfA [Deltaproteobacteria bacterium]MBW2199303.1 30S ribosome-binding factor RbfA [Deltaproteobacteria bacterium]MBW2538137.1 30S ribosome-binding factor RbfA [Deltaproteobacteria bacterium]